MRAYGQTRGGTAWDFDPSIVRKGGERLRVRLALLPAIGPVPPSVIEHEPCTCIECARDPAWAEYIRGLETEEHSHLEEIL